VNDELWNKTRILSLGISRLRGVQNLKLIHSVLYEAAKYCEQKYRIRIYDAIIKSGEFIDQDVANSHPAFMYIFYSLSKNIYHRIDPPDSALNMQQDLPGTIREALEITGPTDEELYQIYTKGLENVEKNTLPKAYRENEHVKLELFSEPDWNP
jgi:hypothetical protein